MEENKKIGERKRWKGEREGRLGQELWQWAGPEVTQRGSFQETSQETKQEKRRLRKERLQKKGKTGTTGKNTLFNQRQKGGKERKDQEKRRDKGKLFPKSKERSLRMIQLKNLRKLWSPSSILQKRQHVQRGQQTNAKDFRKKEFREKNGRKLFFRGFDDTGQKRKPDEKRDQGGVQRVVESDTIKSAKSKKRQKNPKIRDLKREILSGKVITNKNLGQKFSLDRNVHAIRKEASDENEDFGLRMDFVDCKCKFGRKTSDYDKISTIL